MQDRNQDLELEKNLTFQSLLFLAFPIEIYENWGGRIISPAPMLVIGLLLCKIILNIL